MLRLDRIVRCAAFCLLAAGVYASATGATLSSAECPAALVRNGKVKAGPFTGHITPRYDVVDGRFRLHVGPYRDRTTGLSQKIPWYISPEFRAGNSLVVTGTRLVPAPARTFKQTFAAAGGRGHIFPSTISPPSAGCWHLKFLSPPVHGSLTVLVRD